MLVRLTEEIALVIVCSYWQRVASVARQSYLAEPTTNLRTLVVVFASVVVRHVNSPYLTTLASEQMFLFKVALKRLTPAVYMPTPGAVTVMSVPPWLPAEFG